MSTTLRTFSLPPTITIQPNLELSQGFYKLEQADDASAIPENPLVSQLEKEVEELGRAVFNKYNPKNESNDKEPYFSLERLFHKAIEMGKALTTEALLQQKISPDAHINGFTPLFQACLTGNKAIIELLLNHNANPNLENNLSDPKKESFNVLDRFYHKAKPISAAAFFGDVDIVKQLEGKGAKLHEPDSNGGLPIFYAVKGKKEQMALYILFRGLDAKVDDAFHLNLMAVAIRSDLFQLTQRIVEIDPKIFEKQDGVGENILHIAARSVHTRILLFLLESSPNKTALSLMSSETKISPLGAAISTTSEDNVKALVEAGADLRQVSDGMDAKSYAKDRVKNPNTSTLTADDIKKRKAIATYLKKVTKQQS